MPFMGQPDYRVYELNRRLQQWTDVSNSSQAQNGVLHDVFLGYVKFGLFLQGPQIFHLTNKCVSSAVQILWSQVLETKG